jgi:menaquinone-9 beta-reductase
LSILLNDKQEFDSDVIVVGAGPAGTAAAHYISMAGYEVMLLDRCKFPRDKVCGDFVSPISQNELTSLGITNTQEFKSSNQITKASVYLDGNKLVSRIVPKIEGLPRYGRVFPRLVLDKLLLDSARKCGTVFLEGHKAVNMRVKHRSVELEAEGPDSKRTLKARLLIGADGSNSTIARIIRGQPPSSSDRIIAIRGYFDRVEGPSSQADLHFNKESFPGYCWLFPTSKNQANVGVGAPLDTIPSGINLKELLEHLINNNLALSRRLKNAKLIGTIGGCPLTTYNPSLPLVDDRVMLVGDAAGLVNPLNGEGIQYALLSGRWASEVAISSLIADDLSKEALMQYQDAVERELRYGMSLARLIVQLIRNRSLNPLWLGSLELMASRSRVDSGYADIVGGILMGTVPQSEATNLEMVRGTIEQAMLSTGLNGLFEMVQDPSVIAKSVLEAVQAGFAVAIQASQNPAALFDWAIKSVNSAINVAATSFNYSEVPRNQKTTDFEVERKLKTE